MSGKGNNNPQEVSSGAVDRIKEDTASQVASGSYDQMHAEVYKQGDTAALASTTDKQASPGLSKSGDFVYATPEQLKNMDLKQLTAYVGQHDDFTKQAVANHPKKLDEITARYTASLGPEAHQTRENVQQFYKNAGLV